MAGAAVEMQCDDQRSQEEKMELQHFHRVVNAFRYYRTHCIEKLERCEKNYHNLPVHHQDLIPTFLEHMNAIRGCINHNAGIIDHILGSLEKMWENKENPIVEPASDFDMDKVKTTLKQFVRDWSEEGAEERAACYQPVTEEILRLFPRDQIDPSSVRVLVPGAGMGRLAFDIAQQGYHCQGNEFSFFMLFASHFVINKCKKIGEFTLYPWVHQHSNLWYSADQVRPVTFPDVSPIDVPKPAQECFTMAAGDFLEIYNEPEVWDAVATVFFVDTAHNIIKYVEAIWHILKPGGYWINMGPLLYHFADMKNEPSIELSYEELRKVIIKCSFELEKEEVSIQATYTHNRHSMLKYNYDCVYFVARKPSDLAPRAMRPPAANPDTIHSSTSGSAGGSSSGNGFSSD